MKRMKFMKRSDVHHLETLSFNSFVFFMVDASLCGMLQ
jgi:hypothetical protein